MSWAHMYFLQKLAVQTGGQSKFLRCHSVVLHLSDSFGMLSAFKLGFLIVQMGRAETGIGKIQTQKTAQHTFMDKPCIGLYAHEQA